MRSSITAVSVLVRTVLAAGCLLALDVRPVRAQVWIGPGGTGDSGSWATATNWNPATIPNAVGAAVTFDTPPANRAVTVDSGAAGFTVGSITFTNNSAFTNALQVGTAGSNLKLDNGGPG
jgi:hypothetical protein